MQIHLAKNRIIRRLQLGNDNERNFFYIFKNLMNFKQIGMYPTIF